MHKKGWIYLIVLILIITGIYGYNQGWFTFNQQSLVTTNTFVNPLWARLECAQRDSQTSISTPVSTSGISVYCNENTEFCDFYATNIPSTWYSSGVWVKYKECNVDGSNCEPSFSSVSIRDGVSQQSFKSNVPVGRKLFVYFERTFLKIKVEGVVAKKYSPYELYRFVGGAKFLQTTGSCVMSTGYNSRIPSDSTYPNPLTRTGEEGSKWVNYVDDWAYGPATNVFTHPQYGEVYCSGARIYDIVELQFKDGSLKKVEPTYSGTRADGDRISGLGTTLGSVQCCPNEPTCGDDFKYKPIDTGTSCFSDIQCANAGGPIPKSSSTYVKWSCQNSRCIESSPIIVECTTDSACAGGQICDLSTTNYGECINRPIGPSCGDNICQVSESAQSCNQDCKEKIIKDNGLQTWQWIVIGLLVIVIGILAFKRFKK